MTIDPNTVSAVAAVASSVAAVASAYAAFKSVQTAREAVRTTHAVELRARESAVAAQITDTIAQMADVQALVDRSIERLTGYGGVLPRRDEMLHYLQSNSSILQIGLGKIMALPEYHRGIRAQSLDELIAPTSTLRASALHAAVTKSMVLSWNLDRMLGP